MPAYNNYFPMNYQPYNYYSPVGQQALNQPNITAQLPSTGIIWVQGEAGAKAYPVAAGNSMLLMDSESEQFYIKSTDASGMPLPLRTFNYKEVVQTSENAPKQTFDTSLYVTKDELESRLNELKNGLKPKKEKVNE